MATVKVKFRESKVGDKEGTIYYQVIHERVIRQINTNYKIFKDEWDEENTLIVPTARRDLTVISERVKWDINRANHIIKMFESKGDYSANDIVATFEKYSGGQTLFNFMQGLAVRYGELRKYRAAETYKTTLNSFMRFRNGEDILLVDITSDLLMDYEAHLKWNNLTNNTISFYMRTLRAVYNRAVEREFIEHTNPFKYVYTGIDKTIKRALSLKDVKKIKELDLSLYPKLDFARDMFMFSFYTRGMSFVDISYLRKKDIVNGVLTYRRRKTNQLLFIKWEESMKEIVNKYTNHTEYVLPIITNSADNERLQYQNKMNKINIHLKEIANMIKLETPLTMYVARHSWASIAKSRNIPISVISEGMGHNRESTTQIYLASLDTSVVDRANNAILKLLK